MIAQELVSSYIASLSLCLRALRSEFDSVTRADATAPLVARSHAGERKRSGRIEGLGTYQLHGVGCRLELDTGEEVDFDWDRDGNAIFTPWRLRTFAESLGIMDVEEGELAKACRDFVRDGLLEEAEGQSFRIQA